MDISDVIEKIEKTVDELKREHIELRKKLFPDTMDTYGLGQLSGQIYFRRKIKCYIILLILVVVAKMIVL